MPTAFEAAAVWRRRPAEKSDMLFQPGLRVIHGLIDRWLQRQPDTCKDKGISRRLAEVQEDNSLHVLAGDCHVRFGVFVDSGFGLRAVREREKKGLNVGDFAV